MTAALQTKGQRGKRTRIVLLAVLAAGAFLYMRSRSSQQSTLVDSGVPATDQLAAGAGDTATAGALDDPNGALAQLSAQLANQQAQLDSLSQYPALDYGSSGGFDFGVTSGATDSTGAGDATSPPAAAGAGGGGLIASLLAGLTTSGGTRKAPVNHPPRATLAPARKKPKKKHGATPHYAISSPSRPNQPPRDIRAAFSQILGSPSSSAPSTAHPAVPQPSRPVPQSTFAAILAGANAGPPTLALARAGAVKML